VLRKCTQQRRWFITGVSSGLGRKVAEVALSRGHFIAGTVRDQQAAEEFEQLAPGRSLAYWVDLTNEEQLHCAIQRSCKALGGLDVLYNNAGYGLLGALEELSESDMRRHFDIHFWSTVRTVQALLPCFRERGKGHFINAVCSAYEGPGCCAMQACNAAIASLTEGLAREVNPLGIHVTLLDVGPLNTRWAAHAHQPQTSLPAYAALRQDYENKLARPGRDAGAAALSIVETAERCFREPFLRLDLQVGIGEAGVKARS
jgi:NAD(P)-dependent dehydrogenase (short-subunit alcohol dehydrogenase family)